MLKTLSFRCLAAFAILDLLFSPMVVFAYRELLSIDGSASVTWILLGFALLKIVAWSSFFTHELRAYELFARLPDSARTASVLSRADHVVQNAPRRMAVFYAFTWVVSYASVTLVLLRFGPAGLDISPRALEATALLCVALWFGAFAFAFPLALMLTADSAMDCSKFAQSRGIPLERAPVSLQFRISLIAFSLAIGPTLWIAAVGYMKQVESSHALRVARVQHAATTVVSRVRENPVLAEALATPIVPDTQDDKAALDTFVVDGAGLVLSGEIGERAVAADSELKDWLKASVARPSATLVRVSADRVAALERIDQNRFGVALLRSAPRAPTNFVMTVLIFSLVVAVWAPVCSILLGRAISGPLERLTGAARQVVEEGNISSMGNLSVASNDEIGLLTDRFNHVLDLMRSLSAAANAIARGDLRAEVSGTGELPDAFRGMLESLRTMVHQIRSTSMDLASAAAEIFAASQEQESAAASQSSAMIEISRTMESLSDSAAHVSDAVQGVLSNAERTLRNTDDMVGRIGQLSTHASRIGEILEVIRDIADKSDLLALNGSLEASRAGDGGRGFALVAGEMRRLAERVTASVQDVKRLVTDIRDSGSSTVMATEESRKLAEGTTEAARQITFVTQQQRSGTEQVSQSVKNIADVLAQTVSATSQTRTSAQGLKSQADLLAELVKRFELITAEAA